MLDNVVAATERDAAEQNPRRILNNIHLMISPGEWLNIVGTNGCGKSTLARLIAGVTVEGAAGLMQRGFAGAMPAPYVMQQPDVQLFGETPREEIRFALEWRGLSAAEIETRIAAVLEHTQLSALADLSWEYLSGGQRQMAAIAAALAVDAPLIVCDEATSMLDDEAGLRALALVRSMHERGAAVVWVTQRLQELNPGQRIIAMREGEISFDGNVRSFFYGNCAANRAKERLSPCEACGLRLPYLAALAVEWSRQGLLADPLPVTSAEWRKVLNER